MRDINTISLFNPIVGGDVVLAGGTEWICRSGIPPFCWSIECTSSGERQAFRSQVALIDWLVKRDEELMGPGGVASTDMTETVSQKNHFEITKELRALQKAVKGSRIRPENESGPPACTVDGKREVISIDGKYDLWAPKRKPEITAVFIDDTSPWTMGASFAQAVAFLKGATKKDVLSMEAQA